MNKEKGGRGMNKMAIFGVALLLAFVPLAQGQNQQQEEQVGIIEGVIGITVIILSSFLYSLIHPVESCHLLFNLSPEDINDMLESVFALIEFAWGPPLGGYEDEH